MSQPNDIIFYDGNCGLCHWWIRFAVKRDKTGQILFAPLNGERSRQTFSETDIKTFPESIIFFSKEGKLYFKFFAVQQILNRLGGFWQFISYVTGIFPTTFLNWLYDQIAKNRKRLFKTPENVCPRVPEPLSARFIS